MSRCSPKALLSFALKRRQISSVTKTFEESRFMFMTRPNCLASLGLTASPSCSPHDLADRPFIVALLALLVIGGGARFYHLSYTPIWMDEAYTYFVSIQPLHAIAFNRIDNHPPLFYLLQHFWNEVDPAIDDIRLPAAAIGTVTVLTITLAAADLINRIAGLAAGAFLAFSTGHVYFSQEARMYTLLCFGLALATWGVLGLADGRRKQFYAILYLSGASIAIYSQVVALIYLAILNGLLLACSWLLKEAKPRFYATWLLVNFLLMVFSLPWLLSLREAAESFQGLPAESAVQTQWFFRNLVGFPGLPFPVKQLADASLLVVYMFGAIFGWNNGRRTLAATCIGTLVIYPIAIAFLNLSAPILANRIFIPCVICAAILFGSAVASLRRPIAQMSLATVVLLFAAWSTIEAKIMQVKTEDTPQALALVDAYGFENAPILCSNFWTASTAFFYAANRAILFPGPRDELIRFDERILQAYSLPASQRVHIEDGPMRHVLTANGLVVYPVKDWNSVKQVAVLSASAELPEQQLLNSLGFHKIDAPPLTSPKQLIFQPLSTNISLWAR
jgi:uncharacterized membrane protein